jgi:hypothetical protein
MECHCRKQKQKPQDSYVDFDQGKYIMTENKTPTLPAQEVKPTAKQPNETGSISVEGFVRIFDPNTNEKFVEKRA